MEHGTVGTHGAQLLNQTLGHGNGPLPSEETATAQTNSPISTRRRRRGSLLNQLGFFASLRALWALSLSSDNF